MKVLQYHPEELPRKVTFLPQVGQRMAIEALVEVILLGPYEG
jgi:hypothetical protein